MTRDPIRCNFYSHNISYNLKLEYPYQNILCTFVGNCCQEVETTFVNSFFIHCSLCICSTDGWINSKSGETTKHTTLYHAFVEKKKWLWEFKEKRVKKKKLDFCDMAPAYTYVLGISSADLVMTKFECWIFF